MKKVLAFLAVAALCVCACGEKDGPNNGGGKNNGGDDYQAPITIDASFDDWAAIEDKVATYTCPAGHPKPDIKLCKVYADKYYVYLYVEFDYSAYEGEVSDNHFNICINGDNDTTTGGYEGDWAQGETPCIDLLIQGDVLSGGAAPEAFDPFVGTYANAANAADWGWSECEGLSGFIEGKGTKKAWEFKLTREVYPAGKLAKEFTMGLSTCVNGWDSTGALPAVEPTEENAAGRAPLMTVTLSK